jgi:hypothetical protein
MLASAAGPFLIQRSEGLTGHDSRFHNLRRAGNGPPVGRTGLVLGGPGGPIRVGQSPGWSVKKAIWGGALIRMGATLKPMPQVTNIRLPSAP